MLLWLSWFTILGFMRMLAMLTRDRFEYVCLCEWVCMWVCVFTRQWRQTLDKQTHPANVVVVVVVVVVVAVFVGLNAD